MISKDNYDIWAKSIHILFWLMITIAMILIFNGILKIMEVALVAVSINLLGFIVLVYVHLFFLIPKFFIQKRYLAYGVGLLLLLLLTSAFRFFVGWLWVVKMNYGLEYNFSPSYFGSVFFSGIFIVLITIPLRLIDNWFKKRELEKELKTHQLEAELRFLKAQVNPHFLFNALNNIYALSFTESKKAPDMILKLSDMMSYMLYDCKHEQVRLSAEIDYLKNYIALQQLKKDGEFNIDFDVDGEVESVLITPMLFIPFFENAFKHGNLEDTEKGWLKSTLSVKEGRLRFDISNTTPAEISKKGKGGVGLKNIQQRLALLFPNHYQLDIQKVDRIFSVHLTINLQAP